MNNVVSYQTPSLSYLYSSSHSLNIPKIIQIIEKTVTSGPFSHNELPWGSSQTSRSVNFTKEEKKIIQTLINIQAAYFHFTPAHIFNEYSLDSYWVKLPLISDQKL
jgi:hypothetical protein